MAIVTLPGGDSVNTPLTGSQAKLLGSAVSALSSQGPVTVATSLNAPIVPGQVTVYNVPAPPNGGALTIPAGSSGLIVSGNDSVVLNGRTGAPLLLVGNNANDIIYANGGSGTIIGGNGSNMIAAGRGDVLVQT